MAAVALAPTVGFCNNEVNAFGPVHEYVVIPAGSPVRLRAFPAHTGPLLLAVAIGNAFTTTVVVTVFVQPLALLTERVYTPAMVIVVLAEIVGLCEVLVKPFGPVHE